MSWITNIVLEYGRGRGNRVKWDWHTLHTAEDGGKARVHRFSLYFSLTQTQGKAGMAARACNVGPWEAEAGEQKCSALLRHTQLSLK